MWFLSRIVGNARTQAKVLSRLRPNESYAVNPKSSQDKSTGVEFKVLGFTEEDVASSRSRPDVILRRNGLSVVVDGHPVTEDEKYLHDQQIIHFGKGNSGYMITWEPVSIYHDKSQNPQIHQRLIEQGTRLGFYVIHRIRSSYDKPTHYCVSNSPESLQTTPLICSTLAHNKVYFIRPDWIEELNNAIDKNFDLYAFNSKIQPIIVDEFENSGQTAIFGPDERRKGLFKRMDFWFFDQQQFNCFEKLIKIVGGKAELKTCEQVLGSDIDGNPLFVAPPSSDMLPHWPAVHEQYCKEMDVTRVLYEQEIVYAIVSCSTNVMCNPTSAPMEYMNPDSALYASFESASLYPTSVKMESLDPTMPVTCPHNDMDYKRHDDDDEDDCMQVKPEPVESTLQNSVGLDQVEQDGSQRQQQEEEPVYHRRVIKEEVHQDDQEMEESLADTVPISTSPAHDSSPAFAAEPPAPVAEEVREEALSANSRPLPPPTMSPSISQQIESLNAIPASMDLEMDVDAFLDGAFENLQSQKKKDKETKLQQAQEADQKRQEEEIATQENRRKEQERQELLRERIARETADYEARLQRQTDYNAGLGGGNVHRDAEMEDSTEEPVVESLEDQEAPEQDQSSSAPATESHQEEAPVDYRNDPTVIDVVEPNPDQGQFSRIIYRNLEVNPRPPPPANGIVNYKKFKKVKQFENYSSFEQSQVFHAATTSSQNNNRRRARDIFQDTDPGTLIPEDPDIAIRVNRPRRG